MSSILPLPVSGLGQLVRGEGLRVRTPPAVSPQRGVFRHHGETFLPADGGFALPSRPQPVHGPDGERAGHFTGETQRR